MRCIFCTAGLLAQQTPDALAAIQSAIEKAVLPYARGNGFAIPKAAYVVAVRKSWLRFRLVFRLLLPNLPCREHL